MEVRRGYVPTDLKEFSEEGMLLLRKAQEELLYLLERGYPIKSASTFVGNHYLLSERQRLAIVRATATEEVLKLRRDKQKRGATDASIFIDGLNTIISLEVALSGSTLIRCMDDTIRDLAGLRGTYRVIDKTEEAIRLIGNKLSIMNIKEAVFYLDSPVSNTGRLKSKILDLLNGYPFQVIVELVNNPDVILEKSENVITSDAIILNQCKSWFNLVSEILKEQLPEVNYVDLSLQI